MQTSGQERVSMVIFHASPFKLQYLSPRQDAHWCGTATPFQRWGQPKALLIGFMITHHPKATVSTHSYVIFLVGFGH